MDERSHESGRALQSLPSKDLHAITLILATNPTVADHLWRVAYVLFHARRTVYSRPPLGSVSSGEHSSAEGLLERRRFKSLWVRRASYRPERNLEYGSSTRTLG